MVKKQDSKTKKEKESSKDIELKGYEKVKKALKKLRKFRP
jgi:hypothetical protein